MKKSIFLIAIVFVVIVLTNQNVLATGTDSEFSDYTITEVNDLYLAKDVKAVWKISYCSTEDPVTVIKHKTLEGTEYVVHSKYFDVCYLSSTKGFGAKEVRNCCKVVPKKITSAVLNVEQLKRQQIITPNPVDEEKALGLIACFLPDLLNKGYTHLLN